MKKPVEIKLVDYVDMRISQLQAFKEMWMNNSFLNPSYYPAEMYEGDFDEQFSFFIEDQNDRKAK